MSSPVSTTSSRSSTAVVLSFPPIFGNQPEFSVNDPFGTLPFNRRIRITRNVVLEWNNEARALVVYSWPVLNGRRAAPSEFSDLRRTHAFRNPSCLCAMESPDASTVTESVIFMMTAGGLAGEYVAACAQRRCKYFIMLERFYGIRGLPVRSYPLRAMGAQPPAAINFDTEEFESHHSGDINGEEITPTRATRRTRAPGVSLAATRVRRRRPVDEVADEGETSTQGRKRRRLQAPTVPLDPIALPTAAPLADASLSPFRKLMLLDDAGLRLSDFKGLIQVCRSCKDWVGTVNAFDSHNCPGPETIDLTVDA